MASKPPYQVQPGLALSPWPKAYGNAQNSGRGTGRGAKGRLKWLVREKGFMTSVVIGANGLLYMGGINTFYVLHAASGKRVTSFRYVSLNKLGDSDSDEHFMTPAIGRDGTVYADSGNNNFYALNGKTGKRKWIFHTWFPFNDSEPNIGSDGTVYVGSNDGSLHVLDGKTGREKWYFATANYADTCPALNQGMVYITSRDGRVYGLDAQTGKLRWRFQAGELFNTGDVFHTSPAVGSNGIVYASCKNGKVYALDGRTGKLKWAYQTQAELVTSPAIGRDGTVYISGWEGLFYALDGKTGRKKWAFPVEYGGNAAVASDGTVYVCADKIYALNGRTGAKKWTLKIGRHRFHSPAIGSDGTLYLSSYDGFVCAVR